MVVLMDITLLHCSAHNKWVKSLKDPVVVRIRSGSRISGRPDFKPVIYKGKIKYK